MKKREGKHVPADGEVEAITIQQEKRKKGGEMRRGDEGAWYLRMEREILSSMQRENKKGGGYSMVPADGEGDTIKYAKEGANGEEGKVVEEIVGANQTSL
jgi:hypothetical protein